MLRCRVRDEGHTPQTEGTDEFLPITKSGVAPTDLNTMITTTISVFTTLTVIMFRTLPSVRDLGIKDTVKTPLRDYLPIHSKSSLEFPASPLSLEGS
jgi:hypothetical protein